MASVNKSIILGHLGRDPEVRTFPEGGTICNFTIATSRKWKVKDSNEWQEETEWHRIVAHGRLAEIAGEYLKKGKPVYVEGRLKTRKWTDKEGKDNYTTEIVAESMQLLGGREDSQAAPAPAQRTAAPRPSPNATSTGFDDMDDDIPF